jgi:acetyltransferase-like isoleucine patch superfamily enzyme
MTGIEVTLPYLGQGDIALAKSMARRRAGAWGQLQHRVAGHEVARGATLRARGVIVCGTTIEHHAFVAGVAVVTRDVPPMASWSESRPANQVGF